MTELYVDQSSRLRQHLSEAEASAKDRQIGDIAWLIGNFPETQTVGGWLRKLFDDYPRIRARLAETTPMRSEGEAMLQVRRFIDDDTIVGSVATIIVRTWGYGHKLSFETAEPPVQAPKAPRSPFNLKRSALVALLEDYLALADPDAKLLKQQLGDRYKTCSGPELAEIFAQNVPGWRLRYAGQFEGEDDFEQL